jgi:hypothetical protein
VKHIGSHTPRSFLRDRKAEAVSISDTGRRWNLWAFQGIETAIYLALALALTGYCFRRLNRRLS